MNEPLLTCFTEAALKHARARGIPGRLVSREQWERDVLEPIRVPPEKPAVQESEPEGELHAVPPTEPVVREDEPQGEWAAVPPQKPEVQAAKRCTTPIEESGGTPVSEAMAQAHTPFARQARSGGTPKPGASKAKRKTSVSIGRAADGPACIGCSSYEPLYKNEYLYGYGRCTARDGITRAATDRHACALYQFHAKA